MNNTTTNVVGWALVFIFVLGGVLAFAVGWDKMQEPAPPPPPTPVPAGPQVEAAAVITARCTGLIVSGSCNSTVTQDQRQEQPAAAPEAGEAKGWERIELIMWFTLTPLVLMAILALAWREGR